MDIEWDFVWKLAAVAAGTYFWLWFLVYEQEQRREEAIRKQKLVEEMDQEIERRARQLVGLAEEE